MLGSKMANRLSDNKAVEKALTAAAIKNTTQMHKTLMIEQ